MIASVGSENSRTINTVDPAISERRDWLLLQETGFRDGNGIKSWQESVGQTG